MLPLKTWETCINILVSNLLRHCKITISNSIYCLLTIICHFLLLQDELELQQNNFLQGMNEVGLSLILMYSIFTQHIYVQ